MIFGKKEKSSDLFWQEYEEKTGEKVLARDLGRYISGWEEFENRGWSALGGLIIVCSLSLRFHYFPPKTLLENIFHISDKDDPKDITFFIPKEKIISSRIIKEKKLWKRILKPTPPVLEIHYIDKNENSKRLLLEADFKGEELIESLKL